MNGELALPEALRAILPQELVRAAGKAKLLSEGGSFLRETAATALRDALNRSLHGAATLMLLGVLCGALTVRGGKEDGAQEYVPLCGVLCAALLSAGDFETLMGLGARTVEELSVLSKVLLPVVASAMAAGGLAGTGSVWQVTALFASGLLTDLIQSVLLPLVYCYLALCAADAVLPGGRLRPLSETLQKGTGWTLTALLTVYSVFLTLSGVLTGSADRTALRMTKLATGAVPVVGGVLSDAAESVLAGASALRSTLGTLGVLGVLAVSLAPLLRMAVQYVLCRAAAFVCAVTGCEELKRFVECLATACSLVLAMTAGSALLLTVSLLLASSMAVGL